MTALYIYARLYVRRTVEMRGGEIPPMLIELPNRVSQMPSFLKSIDKRFFDAILDDFIELAPFIKGMERVTKASVPLSRLALSEADRLDGRTPTTGEQIVLAYLDLMLDIDILKEKMKLSEIRKNARELIDEAQEEKDGIEALKKRFVDAIERKKFPVDAKKLIDNYFTLSKKEPEKAYKTLITNPLYFSPILLERMQKKFFGLTKPTAQDAIDVNKQLASFLKRLKA